MQRNPAPEPSAILDFRIHGAEGGKARRRIEIEHQIGKSSDLCQCQNSCDFCTGSFNQCVLSDKVLQPDKADGKRTDHDSLPEEIKDIWEKNAERYKKIKQAHETCKTLTAACDRYEYTKAIAEMWANYKKDFDTYDHYVLVDVNEEAGTQTSDTEEVQLSAEDVKAINAARPYISKNLPKLIALVAAAKQEGFTEALAQELESWRDRIQQRVDVLIRTKQVIKDELRQQLTEADIKLEISDSDGQGQEHSDDSPATE